MLAFCLIGLDQYLASCDSKSLNVPGKLAILRHSGDSDEPSSACNSKMTQESPGVNIGVATDIPVKLDCFDYKAFELPEAPAFSVHFRF